MRRGDVRWAQLSPVVGHEQAGRRPVLIVSDDRYMAARKLAIVFPLTTNDRLRPPIAVELASVGGRRSFALAGQIRTLALSRMGLLLLRATEREIEECLTAMLHICGRTPQLKADNDG